MADSDDEYDRKRRDKFRGERAEANYRGTERSVRTRDEWQEREAWSRPRPRDYRGSVRDRGYSPSMETAPKRIRHDYYGDSYYNHYQPYHQSSHREPQGMSSASESSQPPMMSFKAFLATQDDNISDSEAIEKYNDYKLEFQRQQLNEFFVAHKDDEWFRLKYHPEDSVKRKEEQAAALKKRVEVFLDLLNAGKLNSLSVDCHKTNELLKLLDTVVIKLEGGNEEDLELLEQEYAELEKKEQKSEENAEGNNSNETNNKESSNSKKDNSSKDVVEPETNGSSSKEDGECPESQHNKKPSSSSANAGAEDDDDGEIMQVNEEEESQLKAKKPDNYQEREDNNGKKQDKELKERSDDEDGNTKNKQNNDVEMEGRGGNDEDDNTKNTKNEVDDDRDDQNRDKKSKNVDEEEDEDEDNLSLKKDNNTSKEKKRKRSYSGSSGSSSSSSSSDSDDEGNTGGNKKDNNGSSKKEKKDDVEGEDKEKIETIDDSSDKIEKPKALHKTTSIFLRNLAPTITRQEVEAMCSRYDGFLRVALADPQPDRRWLRRGWVTFKRDANIKEICWNLNNIRLRDCELGAIVNRDLSRRIRPVNGITAHKQVVRSDIRISAKVALHLDTKAGLWPENKEEKPQQTFGLVSNNPVLHNITDYLIEEASAEEEELLGLEPSSDTQDTASTVERDENLISVLDKIIMYLRIVHSVDYYNHCEYPNEDEMPNRCGILHARGPPPTTKTDISQFVGNPIETKMANFLPDKSQAASGRGNAGGEDLTSGSSSNKNETKLINLSLKDVDMEIDKFVQANTRELAKDKWLCPLSGKKFKGPDFVRKHIFNKHAEKIEEVKKEVEFFNNYLRDSKRPMMAEPTVQKREEPPPYSHSYGAPYAYGGPPRYYNQGYPSRPRGYAPRSRGNNSEFRPVIHYRDLDAPREPEEFI